MADRARDAELLTRLHWLLGGPPITAAEADDWLQRDPPAKTEAPNDPT